MKILLDGQAVAALPLPVVMENLRRGTLELIESGAPLSSIADYVSYLIEKQPAGVEVVVDLVKAAIASARSLSIARPLRPATRVRCKCACPDGLGKAPTLP